MPIVSVNTFTNPNGKRVYQVFIGAQPITRELEDRATAVHCAEDAIARSYSKCQRQVWDGDSGQDPMPVDRY